jgi:hypothetical protein
VDDDSGRALPCHGCFFCEAKRVFARLESTGTRVWEASFEGKTTHPYSIWLQVPVFLVLAPACTAVRFGLLLSTLSRLTHILYAVFRRIKL